MTKLAFNLENFFFKHKIGALLQSCRSFNDSGACVEYCPPEQIYNSVTWQWEENPNAKFAYRNTCIKDCRTGDY